MQDQYITRNTIFAVTREARIRENTESRKSEGGEGRVCEKILAQEQRRDTTSSEVKPVGRG